MNPRWYVRFVDAAVVVVVGVLVYRAAVKPRLPEPVNEFARAVNVEPLEGIAIHDAGRIKSFDSFARTAMRHVSGRPGLNGQSAVFSYLDIMLDKEKYEAQDIIYVKSAIRPQLIRILEQMKENPQQVEAFRSTGMISEQTLRSPLMWQELNRLDADVIRTAKFVNLISGALMFSDPHELSTRLRVIPPTNDDPRHAWYAGEDLWGSSFLHAGESQSVQVTALPGMPGELAATLASDWSDLVDAWRAQNAGNANAAILALSQNLAKINPSLYPDARKLNLESWYFRMKAFVWNWIIYICAAVPLLLSVIYRWRGAYRLGIAILVVAFLIHTASLGIRWYLAGRIPNSNMFEAILAATWFGVLGSFVLEAWVRRTAMRGLFFLGSAVCAMVAMMCQHFMPTTLTSDIDNVMPVLNDVWLYIHTNVIIFSYALIGMAAVTALLYLRHRLGGGDATVAKAGGAGSLILDGSAARAKSFLKEESSATTGQVLDASTMVLLELAFVMLWAGLSMGAIWADHSWGRPWGWDPKEVFALCTFVIFLLLVHVRLKVRDKGLWTAVLAVVGCGVMLFNWIVINFYISGLHSYA